MLKKTTIAVLGLAASSIATAGTMGPVCTPGNVTVPCVAQQWDLGVQALYLESAYSATKGYRETFSVADPRRLDDVNSWDWGYRLEGSYHFNTGNDVTVAWTHLSSDSNQTGISSFTPFTLFTPVYAYGSKQDRFDQVNLVLGQHADFGLVKKMRFYGGMQYANIQINNTTFFPGAVPQFGNISMFANTDFKGFGPVTGLDYSYNLTDSLSVTANGAGSILYGTSRINTGIVASPSGLVAASAYGSKKAIVPSLEAKLGANYAYAMAQGVLNLEGGYQVVNYFSPLQGQLFDVFGNSLSSSDYGLYGPYVGVKYVGNA